VRNLSEQRYGRFDVVLCVGLLYHLNEPDVLELLSCTPTSAQRRSRDSNGVATAIGEGNSWSTCRMSIQSGRVGPHLETPRASGSRERRWWMHYKTPVSRRSPK
jgi:hypothetical protein